MWYEGDSFLGHENLCISPSSSDNMAAVGSQDFTKSYPADNFPTTRRRSNWESEPTPLRQRSSSVPNQSVPRHRRSFGVVGEKIWSDPDPPKREKKRDHPFAFCCWLVHLGLVCCIGVLLLYVIYVVSFSKFRDVDFGPQPILSKYRQHRTETILKYPFFKRILLSANSTYIL